MPSTSWTAPPAFTASVLAVSDMNILSDDATFLKNVDRARVYLTADQTITTSTTTRVIWDAEEYDTNGMHSGSNASVTAAVDGLYLVTANIRWQSDTTGRRVTTLRKNDSTTDGTGGTEFARMNSDAVSGGETYNNVSGHVYLSAGDWVRAYVFHNKGSNLNVEADSGNCWLGVVWMGD